MDVLTPPALGELDEVFAAHRSALKRAAHRIVGDPDGAEDLVHDAYLKAVETARYAASPEALRQPLSFAYRVVRNLAIDHYRRHALESQLFEPEECGEQIAGSPARIPETMAIDRQELARVAQALAELPERVRRVFELYRLEGRTQREIGTQMGLSAATVNTLIREALEHCRAALRQT